MNLVKFTRSSKDDRASRVTVRHSQIANLNPIIKKNLGDIVITIKHNKKAFSHLVF
jgi:hypothetical protein